MKKEYVSLRAYKEERMWANIEASKKGGDTTAADIIREWRLASKK